MQPELVAAGSAAAGRQLTAPCSPLPPACLPACIRSDDGLLPVKLRVTGFQGLPADGWGVKADMKGANLMNAESADGGLVDMKLKVRQPPGNYTISFGLLSDETIPPATMTVEVASCGLGDVTVGSGDACETCSSGTFSLNPANPQCDECPAHASCPGGAVMEPLLGYWHSAPRSSQMHRCAHVGTEVRGCAYTAPAAGWQPHKT